MRTACFSVLFIAIAAVGSAQPSSRFGVGPVVRVDRVFLEAGAGGVTAVAGLASTFMFTKTFGVEGDVTWAGPSMERSYEGWFVSFAGPNATREEIERLAPTARRTLGYTPGIGTACALVIRGTATPRVRVGARIGVAVRRYHETSSYTLLTIPDGIDPERVARSFQDESRSRARGGLLLGGDATVRLTDRLSLAPEFRYVYGGPAQVGNKYRELGFGASVRWGF